MEHEFVVPEKSPNDQRQYQALELPNKVKLLFVHDPKAEKAACSVSVGVGSLKDGERSLGLAHFLQHMLFMGSRKFERYNEYSEFMSLNSGFDNAYTSDEETNYHFEIANAKFPEAVERLCDFFVKAMLTSSCIQKQRQAVHEECMLRFGQDNSRKWQILKHFASGPYHNHSIGNNNTLSHPAVQEDLVNFYQNQYSANRITAVLLSAMPIQEMKDKLIPFFEEIENKNLKTIEYEEHFLQDNIGKFVRMQSIKDQVLMEFFWMADNCRPFYHWHPEKYITHVIGHEGKNSLLSLLKARDWASSIVSYSHSLPRQTIFGLELHLTENGQKSHEAVYNLVTAYVASLKAQKHIYDELAETNAVSFKFKENGSNFEYVTSLSEQLHRIPMAEILNWKYQYKEFDASIIDKFLQQLRPENVVVVYSCSEQLQNPIVQKHLGGKFVIQELPKIKKSTARQKFDSLRKNPFLPLSTDLIEAKVVVPAKEQRIWFVQGDFGVCKGGIYLKVFKPESEIFLQFYCDYLDLLLKQITYEAQSLKLEVEISSDNQFTIKIYGFSHTVEKLIEQISPIFSSVHKGPIAQQLFQINKEYILEEYENFYADDVDEILQSLLDITVKSNGMTVEDKIKELQSYKFKAIAKRIDNFWKGAKMEWIVVGNFDKEKITGVLNNFEKSVGTDFSCEKPSISCLKLVKDSPVLNITELESEDIGTSGVFMYKQIGEYNELRYYTLSILQNYIKTPFFDKLRTQQQLAYYLSAHKRNIRGVLSLCFLLISSNTNPKDISTHITTFINNFLQKIDEDLTEQKFDTLKKSIRSQILKPFESLEEYFRFLIREINNGTFCFDRKSNAVKLDDLLSQIKRQDVVNMLKDCLAYNLQLWVVASPHRQQFLEHKIEGLTVEKIKEIHHYYKDRTSNQ